MATSSEKYFSPAPLVLIVGRGLEGLAPLSTTRFLELDVEEAYNPLPSRSAFRPRRRRRGKQFQRRTPRTPANGSIIRKPQPAAIEVFDASRIVGLPNRVGAQYERTLRVFLQDTGVPFAVRKESAPRPIVKTAPSAWDSSAIGCNTVWTLGLRIAGPLGTRACTTPESRR